MGPAIEFENMGLTLGNTEILRGVNFRVEAGELHYIIGPNGGGKTSLIRSLLGQMPHTGTIRIHWQENQTLGYVPQSLNFDTTLPITVEDFLVMNIARRPAFFRPGKKVDSVIAELLDKIGMTGKIRRPFGQLSGGERQRVLLAQALYPQPALLILDEPATGLDRVGAEIMHTILRELQDQGVTIVVIHHDLAEVRERGDTVSCINRELLFSGDPRIELSPERILGVFQPDRSEA